MAAIETCLKKAAGGDFGDFSEQQLVDCGYQQNGANGCNGAPTYSYIQYIADTSLELTHESTYPYLNTAPKLTCPNTEPYNTGAKVVSSYYSYSGDEEKLKALVAEHGAVVTSVAAAGLLRLHLLPAGPRRDGGGLRHQRRRGLLADQELRGL